MRTWSEPDTLFDAARPPGPHDGGELVTVAVSLYRYAAVICEALDSVAAQTHKRLELIVVDDRSPDDSAVAAETWLRANASRFERTRLLQPRINLGLSRARNLAFEQATADMVFVLDADNTLLPQAVSRLSQALSACDAGVAYSQLIYFEAARGLGAADVWSREFFRDDNYIDAMALVRKSAWGAVGGYAELEYGWEDYDFWCRFVEAGINGVFVPELLCRYRVHDASMLRNDTVAGRRRLVETMMARHPWLNLRA